ncbi:MAG: GNAT family N-acetyltransferase [Lutibacter sp.]
MIKLLRTNAINADFIELVKSLDADLKITDGEEYSFYDQFNKLENIKQVIVAYDNSNPVGCGAIKKYEGNTAEIKRMFVAQNGRRKGIATKILIELEQWAKELSYAKCVLETGVNQPEAIEFYRKNGYQIITNYGQYENAINSVCFQKIL